MPQSAPYHSQCSIAKCSQSAFTHSKQNYCGYCYIRIVRLAGSELYFTVETLDVPSNMLKADLIGFIPEQKNTDASGEFSATGDITVTILYPEYR